MDTLLLMLYQKFKWYSSTILILKHGTLRSSAPVENRIDMSLNEFATWFESFGTLTLKANISGATCGTDESFAMKAL